MEMIDSLYKPLEKGEDDGIIRELLLDFYQTSSRKPKQIIVFRDGVCESQFSQVLNIKLDQIRKDFKHLGEDDVPKFIFIVSHKNRRTTFSSYQRNTTTISIVAPICYAHLADAQMGQFIKFEDMSDTSSGQKGVSGSMPVQELLHLHKNVQGSMFFC